MADKQQLPWGLKSMTPGSVKNIPENKLKAFNIGSMNVMKGSTRRELEDIKKKKDQEETDEVYKEFVESFENGGKGINKTWVKGGIANAEKLEDKTTGGKFYKPVSKLLDKKPVLDYKPREADKSCLIKKKVAVSVEKKKTNLELFKEELKVIQEERQERRKVRQDLLVTGMVPPDPLISKDKRFEEEPIAAGISMGILPTAEEIRMGSFTYENDTQTTNLYLGNINPKMTETQICEIFGNYGPLASVKIMWPRTDEEKARGRNCGFVAFMNRKDGERALANLQGKDIMEFEMKLGWGKAVPIPPHPIYIPPALSELTLPPPPSGHPFNAQPIRPSQNGEMRPGDNDLSNYVVKVVIPTEKTLLCLIHRMVEFVVREGPIFEAMIMNREINNPMFRFLFENQSPAHVYYRWKLFSIIQGDSPYSWRTDDFYMFKGGSLWRPPQMNPFSHGMPEELVTDNNIKPQPVAEIVKKCTLTDSQRDKLENLLRDLTPERNKIADSMVWCLDHAENAEEIVECIAESLGIAETLMPKKIARLFLISDLLHNSSTRIPHASFFRRHFEAKLQDIFKNLHNTHERIVARLRAEQFKHKVMSCFRAWEDWAVYPNDFLINLQNVFLGLVLPKGDKLHLPQDENEDNDFDGIPLEEIDGIPLENKEQADDSGSDAGDFTKSVVPYGDEEETSAPKDGKPLFVPSKWEEVDESELESQAMTVSKWELLDQKKNENSKEDDHFYEDEIDGRPVDEEMEDKYESIRSCELVKNSKSDLYQEWIDEAPSCQGDDASRYQLETNESKRARLREIELKVMKYQDELEVNRYRKSSSSVSEQVNEYRQKLLKEMELDGEEYAERPEKDSRDVSDKKKDQDPRCKKSKEDGKERKSDKSGKERSHNTSSSSSPQGQDDAQKRKHRRRSPRRSRSGTPRRRRSRSESRSPSRHKSKKSRH